MNRPEYFFLRVIALMVGMLCTAFGASPDTFSPVVSFQYQESLDEPASQTTLTSPVVSYQYYEWAGDDILTLKSSAAASFYYNGEPVITLQPQGQYAKVGTNVTLSVAVVGAKPLSYQWRRNGVALPNTNGPNITLNNAQMIASGGYSVVVSNSFSQVTSNSASLIIYTSPDTPKPDLPLQFPSSGILASGAILGCLDPTIDQLKWFNVATGKFETPSQSFAGKMAVVLTHGWNSSPFDPDWPTAMAAALVGKYSSKLNVFAWDWSVAANQFLPATAAGYTIDEGVGLGKALIDKLGSEYNMPIHFIGHSFGTLVNRVAADYVHGNMDGIPKPQHSWDALRTHVTLLDEAELIEAVQGVHVDGRLLMGEWSIGNSADNFQDANRVTNLHVKVIPLQAAYVDNYVSETGAIHSNAVNTMLWRHFGVPVGSDIPLPGIGHVGQSWHGYACEWYRQSVLSPTESSVGHFWSFERNTLVGISRPTSFYTQSFNLSESWLTVVPVDSQIASILSLRGIAETAYNLVVYPTREAYKKLSSVGTKVEGIYLDGIQVAGQMLADYAENIKSPNSIPIYSDTAESTPMYFVQPGQSAPIVNQAHWGFHFSLTPGAFQIKMQNTAVQKSGKTKSGVLSRPIIDTASTGNVPGAVYSIVPLHVPLEAVAFSFEYQIQNGADDDFMTMAIDNDGIYSMRARYLEGARWYAAPVFPISDRRGQDIQFIFALVASNGPPAGTLNVRNIQFHIPPRPELSVKKTGPQLLLSWPLSGIDWTVETTTTISDMNSWQAVTSPVVDSNYEHTITVSPAESLQWFRLKK